MKKGNSGRVCDTGTVLMKKIGEKRDEVQFTVKEFFRERLVRRHNIESCMALTLNENTDYN